ncbi:hypothetical protein [Leptolyngbya ohadii]|uniref:hypothetical protein n=1 Tax=Leptolyngbya ohadii TaxID=1962290 RepID=UPI000B59CEAD|nr:hypothetical protein [Leptolyngbya ohadii]
MLQTYLLKRLNILVSEGRELSPFLELYITGELASLGYRIEGRIYGSVLDNLQDTIATLKEMKGDNSKWVPLHSGFPDNLPNPTVYFCKRLLGFLGDTLGQDFRPQLFDLNQFSADPVYQVRVQKLFDNALAQQESRSGDQHTVWHTLRAMPLAEAKAAYQSYMEGFLYANTSIPVWMQEEAVEFIKTFSLDPTRVTFKETIALIGKVLWENERYEDAVKLAKQPTDLLRIFAAIVGADISLQKPKAQRIGKTWAVPKVKMFPKFSKPARRAILQRLNQMPPDILMANLWKYRDLWKEVFNYLHVGEYQQFERIHQAAANLRNSKFRYRGWLSQVQQSLVAGKVPEDLLKQQPGMYARMLRKCLAINPESIESFLEVADQLPTKMLLQLAKYLQYDYERTQRAVVVKSGRMKVLDTNPNALTPAIGQLVHETLLDAAAGQLSQKASWAGKRVYIAADLANLLVPFDARGMSEALNLYPRGSRIPLDMTKTLRLFTFWMQHSDRDRVDVDLSTMFYQSNWEQVDFCSYFQTERKGARHSGDIQSAPPPMGAFEAIDLDLTVLKERGIRFVLPTLNLYAGAEIQTCFCGWMERENTSSATQTFDPKTVRENVQINVEELAKGNWYSVLIDLQEECIVICDVYLRGAVQRNVVQDMASNAALQLERIVNFHQERLTMEELVMLNVRARGGDRVDSAEAADVVYDRVTLEDLL